jgi:nucleoside-diphosphate-sugar epimerase
LKLRKRLIKKWKRSRGNMAAKVYLTGATGRLGRIVLRESSAIPIVRKKSGLKNEIVSDFSSNDLKKILKDADVVIHLAGSRDFLDRKKAWKGNVELTRKIVEATPESVKIIYSSSISVYGKKLAGIPADEQTRLVPDTPYAKTKLEAEKIVASHNHVILRIGTVYGPGFEDYFKVLRLIDKGKMPIIGDGKNRIPFVHADDVVFAIKNAVDNGNGTYILAGECLNQNEVFNTAAKELGVKAPKNHMPVLLAKIYAHLALTWAEICGGEARFIPEDIAVLSSDREFDCRKAKIDLRFMPRPLKEGIAEMAKEYRKRNKS